jgi:putative transposase
VACRSLGVSRATFYRRRTPSVQPAKPRQKPARALTESEQQQVLKVMHERRFMDKAPAEIYATLLDERVYLCSIRTMYRVLTVANEVRERRDQLRHPSYHKRELLATGPNQVWSWDITKVRGPGKWQYYSLYVIMDIYSRYVVGWLLAERESATLAQRLIADSVRRHRIRPGQLTIHADRGTAMTSRPVAFLLADLGVTKTHSRPHTSNDNPYSEAQFKTLKYRPDYPDRFGSPEDARSFFRRFFRWYNQEHYHTGVALLTPEMMHSGRAEEVTQQRATVLAGAYQAHPELFVNKHPAPPPVPPAAWINQPEDTKLESQIQP